MIPLMLLSIPFSCNTDLSKKQYEIIFCKEKEIKLSKGEKYIPMSYTVIIFNDLISHIILAGQNLHGYEKRISYLYGKEANITTSCNMLLAFSDILSNSSMQHIPLSLKTKAPLSKTLRKKQQYQNFFFHICTKLLNNHIKWDHTVSPVSGSLAT